mgnify:CR=1 FL=1
MQVQVPGNTTLEVAAAHVPLENTMSMWHRRVSELLVAPTPKVFSATLARLDNFRIIRVNLRKQNRAAGLACRAALLVTRHMEMNRLPTVGNVILASMVIATQIIASPTQLTT